MAQSVAAFGTLAAVIVSLRLARRHVIDLDLTVLVETYVSHTGGPPPDNRHENADLFLSIFNSGLAESVLISVEWAYRLYGIFPTKWGSVPGFDGMPITLKAGESIDLKTTLQRTPEGWKLRDFGGKLVPLPKPGFFARLVVKVAGGQRFSARTWPIISVLSELPPGGRYRRYR